MSIDIFNYVIGSPLATVISILYVFFFYRLSNHVTGLNQLKNNTSLFSLRYGKDDEEKEKEDEKITQEKIKKAEYKKHMLLLTAGVVGVATASMIDNQSVKHGISWGAVATILCAIFTQWHNYKETHRLLVLGGSLTGLVLFALKMIKHGPSHSIYTNSIMNDSISDPI